MEFGEGSQSSGISHLTSLDVGGHEMTHGVTSRTAGLVYAGESGGLNESTSDVMGTMVEWYANNSNDVPDYIIGEEIFRDYNPEVNYVRRMDHPSLDGGSADCWYNGVGGLDVHESSGVGNHAFYLLSEGSGPKTINGIDYDSPTCNGSTITGIGHDKAAAIWYKALTEQWTSNTNYHDARVGMLHAAKALYGKTSVEYKTVNKVWAAVDVTP
jgi:Zn-dependent metalloprotease